MRPADLEFPDAALHGGETAVGLCPPITFQVAGGTERQVDGLVEIVARLAVAADDVIGHHGRKELAQFVPEGPILVGQFDFGEVHRDSSHPSCRTPSWPPPTQRDIMA